MPVFGHIVLVKPVVHKPLRGRNVIVELLDAGCVVGIQQRTLSRSADVLQIDCFALSLEALGEIGSYLLRVAVGLLDFGGSALNIIVVSVGLQRALALNVAVGAGHFLIQPCHSLEKISALCFVKHSMQPALNRVNDITVAQSLRTVGVQIERPNILYVAADRADLVAQLTVSDVRASVDIAQDSSACLPLSLQISDFLNLRTHVFYNLIDALLG